MDVRDRKLPQLDNAMRRLYAVGGSHKKLKARLAFNFCEQILLTSNCYYCIITVTTANYHGKDMYVSINWQAKQPVYQQIECQIRTQILSGELGAGTMLPSIRMLAKELKVGIITAKRAYDDLCAQGFCYTVQGKGVFVAQIGQAEAEKFISQQLSQKLEQAVSFARSHGVEDDQVVNLLKTILGE